MRLKVLVASRLKMGDGRMKKLMLSIVLVVGLLLVGCAAPVAAPPPEMPQVAEPTPEPEITLEPERVSVSVMEGVMEGVLEGAPEDATWIAPGKVFVGNLYPGAQAEYPITIHNGNDEPTTFAISARIPDHVDEGYVKFPASYCAWVTITASSPVLAPKETRDILVIVRMPETAYPSGEKLEVWISVIDASQTGFVRTELCSRWLITTQ